MYYEIDICIQRVIFEGIDILRLRFIFKLCGIDIIKPNSGYKCVLSVSVAFLVSTKYMTIGTPRRKGLFAYGVWVQSIKTVKLWGQDLLVTTCS